MGSRREILIERVRRLLAAPREGHDAPSRDKIEWTLTEGYAEALALDGERLRLRRRIHEVTTDVIDGRGSGTTELAGLRDRLEATEEDLTDLRELLATLRSRVAQAA